MKKIFIRTLFLFSLFTGFNVLAAVDQTDSFNSFIANMVANHQFNKNDLHALFEAVDIKQKIIETMEKPAEGMSWFKYRKIFMTEKRISSGVKFWQEHADTLKAVKDKYGVPPEIIIAIIGVETQYGGNTGHHRVIDALSTLAFSYPKRSKFFTQELENFLLLCREENMNPLDPTGSYAGAMGIPQFMPSSYRAYSADFEGDKKRDIWNNPADAIASVANYFAKHHWKEGASVAYPVTAKGDLFKKALSKGNKPDHLWKELQALQIDSESKKIRADEKVRLFSYQQEKGEDLWVGLNNFYVITRYNHSPLYALAVFQLSQAIVTERLLALDLQNK